MPSPGSSLSPAGCCSWARDSRIAPRGRGNREARSGEGGGGEREEKIHSEVKEGQPSRGLIGGDLSQTPACEEKWVDIRVAPAEEEPQRPR